MYFSSPAQVISILTIVISKITVVFPFSLISILLVAGKGFIYIFLSVICLIVNFQVSF